MYLLVKEVNTMEITFYLMENLVFPLLVGIVILYIERYMNNKSKNK